MKRLLLELGREREVYLEEENITILENEEYSERFAKLSSRFTTVICCRLLPIQKAQTVACIKNCVVQ